MTGLTKKIYNLELFSRIKDLIRQQKFIHINGLPGSSRAFLCTYINEKTNQPLLYIANNFDSAEQLRDDLEIVTGNRKISFLPAIDFEPYDTNDPNPSLVSLRMESLQHFIECDNWLAVTYPEGLSETFPTPEQHIDNQIYFKKGNDLDFTKLQNHLQYIGFERNDVVEKVGDYCIRGGIIDIYAWNVENPIRIEFFGNTIESIRHFDVLSQRSIEPLDATTILPNFTENEKSVFIDSIIPDNTILFFEDLQIIRQKLELHFERSKEIFEKHETLAMDEITPDKKYLSIREFENLIEKRHYLKSDLVKSSNKEITSFNFKPHPDFNGRIKSFLEYLRKQSQHTKPHIIYIQTSNSNQSNRFHDIIEEEDIDFNGKIEVGSLHSGFIIPEINMQILTDHQIFNRYKKRKTYKRFKSGEYLRQLSNLNLYDYVVHIDYGIGKYLGMETVNYGNVKKECIKIAYQDNDFLYVTVDRLNRVQKYSTEDSIPPKLTKLGSTEWERVKKKTKDSLKIIASELIQIYAGRKAQEGYKFSQDNYWQKELEASFLYEETEDQITSIQSIKEDMESEKPMDRLLCGDVGFGKTEVALRAAFKAVIDGKQTAILTPTTILAFQHFTTFKDRLAEFPVTVEMLNRFRTVKQQKEILEKLVTGKIDIIIGTHRLISDDVRFKDLGLLVIDEEQRFGVRQKEKLKKLRLSVDILSMTATPIPRTLHMALMGARDLSHINTPPRNRLPVHTEIIHWNEDHLYEIFKREISRGGQIYFVHNRVETIKAIKNVLEEIIPEARIIIGHGQLPERQLEKVMLDFMARKFDILIASMIIENGLDIPNVNTIIINRADRFGLAQLYQLRGRVGRSDQQAYCYLIVPTLDKITELARKRLRAIQDFTDLGSGYTVALRDLEIRGAGNLLGREQSGFVQSIGFELYCKILDEAVAELKGEKSTDIPENQVSYKRYTDPKIDVDFDLLIPMDYISNELERITIYHRLVNFSSIEQVENLRHELRDRFGSPPTEVNNFFDAIELKILTSYLYAERIILKDNYLKIFFNESAKDDDSFFEKIIPKLMQQKIAQIKFINRENLAIQVILLGDNWEQKMSFAKKLLQHVLAND
jgi:transcription-repair coupling factor (superfamily II helicase)